MKDVSNHNRREFAQTPVRWGMPLTQSANLRYYRITAKNCLVDGATLYDGATGDVFPAAHNGGAMGLQHNYVIAKPCNERGIFLVPEDPEQEGYAPDTVLVCLPAAFRGFVAHDTVITAQPFVVPSQIDVGISRCVIAVTGGIQDIIGIGIDTLSSGFSNNVILYKDRTPFYDGVDSEIQTSFVNFFNVSVPDGALLALVWELNPEMAVDPDNPVRSRLRLTDYGCPLPEVEE